MPDTPITHEELETVLKTRPLEAIGKLPDCVESREAKRLVEVVDDLAHRARERIKPA